MQQAHSWVTYYDDCSLSSILAIQYYIDVV